MLKFTAAVCQKEMKRKKKIVESRRVKDAWAWTEKVFAGGDFDVLLLIVIKGPQAPSE